MGDITVDLCVWVGGWVGGRGWEGCLCGVGCDLRLFPWWSRAHALVLVHPPSSPVLPQLDFGAVSVGIPSDQVATVKNVGNVAAVFWISPTNPSIKAYPDKGCILGGVGRLLPPSPPLPSPPPPLVSLPSRSLRPLMHVHGL
jgi:hypothetical protein